MKKPFLQALYIFFVVKVLGMIFLCISSLVNFFYEFVYQSLISLIYFHGSLLTAIS